MKKKHVPAFANTVRQNAARIPALAFALSLPAGLHAAELIKADNTTNLALQGSYVNATADTATADTLRFDSTLVTNGTFSWSADNVTALKVVDPALAIRINMTGGSTYSVTNAAAGTVVIDMSAATKDLTLNNGNLRVRGTSSTSGTATISIGSGATLNMQSNLAYNNPSNGTCTIQVIGSGNMIVGGTNGKIADKNLTGRITAFAHNGSGIVTFSNVNDYTGGTSLNSGTLVAGVSGALGGGSVTVSGGTLDLNGASALNLSLAAGKNLTMSAGTMSFNLGASSDQITSAGSAGFILSGGILALTLGSGFDYNTDYQLFSGFSSGLSSVSGVSIIGYDTVNYTASVNTSGVLDFVPVAVPEPSTYASLCGGLVLAGCVARRRGRSGKPASEI